MCCEKNLAAEPGHPEGGQSGTTSLGVMKALDVNPLGS